MARGRPTAYEPAFADRAHRLCLLGVTDSILAAAFGVAESTLNTWKKTHPDFAEALRLGKVEADAEVALSLYNKALGGDVTACIFWLKNRQPSQWRDKINAEVSGQGGVTVVGTGYPAQAVEVRFVEAVDGKPALPEPQGQLIGP